MSHDRSTQPKDVALYLGVIIALYWSLGSLITLLFHYIDVLFPDEQLYYFDPYSGPIRFAMASLIIVVPIFLFLMRLINRDARVDPDKRESKLRKWLLYITLFIGGIIIAGDLIALVNNFLGGELTMPFLLKVFTLLAVVGSAFTYFFYDLRGFWYEHEKESVYIGVGAGVVVLLSLVAGFMILGSPATQRDIRLDEERVRDLQDIERRVVEYYRGNGELPGDILQLGSNLSGMELPTDPKSDEQYKYTPTSDTGFELCATFAEPSPDHRLRADRPTHGTSGDSWEHGEGYNCFSREINPEIIKPTGGPAPQPAPTPTPVR